MRFGLKMFEVKPGLQFCSDTLKDLLPDVETALFFAKVYSLDYQQLSNLLYHVIKSDVATALFTGDHSVTLQDYLIGGFEHADWCNSWGDEEDWNDECNCSPVWHDGVIPEVERGNITFDAEKIVPHGEILPQVWEDLEVTVAQSIKDVAEKLEGVVNLLPGKQGSMVFQSMLKMNRTRPTLGVHEAHIHHEPEKQNLLILDVSGSMTEYTVRTIVDDVVSLSYKANCHLAIVSNTTTYWEPGTYSTEDVLAHAQYGGTHYETLKDLFDRDWGVVITVADYDSSRAAKTALASCKAKIDTVLDISLVNQPTYLAECVGQMADTVRPLLVGQSYYVTPY